MTEADPGAAREPVAIPEDLDPEIQRAVDRLMVYRLANRVSYGATSEAQFGEAVGADIDTQRVYLEHQITHTDARIRAFESEEREALPDLSALSREELLALYDAGTQGLERVFRDLTNWGRRVNIPYSPPGLTGLSIYIEIRSHEADHSGQNRSTLGHFGIPLPPEVIATSGK